MTAILETARLLLRELTEADADQLVLLGRNPNVMRYIPGEPPADTHEQALAVLRERVFPQYALRVGRWACIEKEHGHFLGWCGVKYIAEDGEYDVGYRFFEHHWGKGYATEAATATRDFARERLRGERVVGKAMVDNVASRRVLEKIGLVYEKEEACEGGRMAVYVLRDAPAIRKARREDAPALAAAERAIAKTPGLLASRPDEIDDDAVREMIVALNDRGRGNYLVAEDAGTVVGHALLDPLPLAVTAHVVRLTIAVHEGHQGRGVGKALMNELLGWARSNPRVEKVELQVRSSNERAVALYRSLGFVEEGRKTKRLKIGPSHYIDDIYMALWVGP